jgi:MoaA/NifB/PqqE/SkfB family radical SAM enzyme/polysaccharide pyruvyl transferase WcaK-like protein
MILKDIARTALGARRIKASEKLRKNRDKPTVINLLANDICNSKCTMCYIWKQKRDIEFSPEQLASILADDLFSEVRHVGITGGEPTLRKDLVDLYSSCIDSLPNLVGLSIITNAIQAKQVCQKIESIVQLCRNYNVGFTVMISLDGLGEVHDTVRGREGNFETAIEVYEFCSALLDPSKVSIGCTITKDNVWNMHEMLDFLESRNIYGRFRVAEYINRLYNDGIEKIIRHFDEVETYELTTFFIRLIEKFEPNLNYQRTYGNIISMLNGGKREIKCPYQTEGIVIDCRGNLQYCAPKSNQIGNALEKSSLMLWKEKKEERERVIEQHCDDCIHDYHAPLSLNEYYSKEKKDYWQKIFCIEGYKYHHKKLTPVLKAFYGKAVERKVFITGWYGTETVGDKAILGGIVNSIKEQYKGYSVVISTLTRKEIVHRTLLELGVEAEVISAYSADFVKACLNSEVTIMGGGPLMDIGTMWVPLWAFHLSKSRGNKTILWGCGLGPLNLDKSIYSVEKVLDSTDEALFRDNNSKKLAQQIYGSEKGAVIRDPSYEYVKSIRKNLECTPKQEIACFLREWPREYALINDDREFKEKRFQLEKAIAKIIIDKANEKDAKVVLYPMHSLEIGGDDRKYARYFIETYLKDVNATYFKKPASVVDICTAMLESELNVCMRFHSVAFASTLETEFIAIDYTMGGKILGLLTDEDKMDRYHGVLDLIN